MKILSLTLFLLSTFVGVEAGNALVGQSNGAVALSGDGSAPVVNLPGVKRITLLLIAPYFTAPAMVKRGSVGINYTFTNANPADFMALIGKRLRTPVGTFAILDAKGKIIPSHKLKAFIGNLSDGDVVHIVAIKRR